MLSESFAVSSSARINPLTVLSVAKKIFAIHISRLAHDDNTLCFQGNYLCSGEQANLRKWTSYYNRMQQMFFFFEFSSESNLIEAKNF